jgi:hypothetical protein
MGYPKSNIEGLLPFSTLEIERANSLTTEKAQNQKEAINNIC